MTRATLLVLLMFTTSVCAQEESTPKRELRRIRDDAKAIATAPLHWTSTQWTHFAEGAGAVAAVYAADSRLYADVQRNRSTATNDFAKFITPFGARRALDISALMLVGGALSHEQTLRDAGADSLEAEVFAGGIVTPLLKRAFGRARPIQNEGAHSFHAFSGTHESFPSGHATNVFAFATAIAAHYDNWIVPTIVYTIAGGVAMSRVNDRAHFPSDVLAGALIGRAIAKGVVAQHAHGKVSWSITPSLVGGRPGLTLHLMSPAGRKL